MPTPPYMVILWAEIVDQPVRNDIRKEDWTENIQDYTICSWYTDLNWIFSQLLTELVSNFIEYSIIGGLKINFDKTEGMRIHFESNIYNNITLKTWEISNESKPNPRLCASRIVHGLFWAKQEHARRGTRTHYCVPLCVFFAICGLSNVEGMHHFYRSVRVWIRQRVSGMTVRTQYIFVVGFYGFLLYTSLIDTLVQADWI